METANAWIGIDHVQLAMPVGAEEVARDFYVRVLGLVEVPKPAALLPRGGCWFEAGAVRVHLGTEDDFRPARKAHPALLRRDLRDFIEESDLDATWADEIPGIIRCHVADPFGNRIELVEAIEEPR